MGEKEILILLLQFYHMQHMFPMLHLSPEGHLMDGKRNAVFLMSMFSLSTCNYATRTMEDLNP